MGLGQGIGSGLVQGVLRRDDEEKVFQWMRLIVHGHLFFRHRLQQGRLDLGTGAVDLVGQHHVGEERAARNSNEWLCGSNMVTPVMSDGSMSGVNCSRRNEAIASLAAHGRCSRRESWPASSCRNQDDPPAARGRRRAGRSESDRSHRRAPAPSPGSAVPGSGAAIALPPATAWGSRSPRRRLRPAPAARVLGDGRRNMVIASRCFE